MQGLRGYHIFCVCTHMVATGLHKEHTFPAPSPPSNFAASNYHASVAKVLERGRKGASLGKCHFPAKMVQKCAKMAYGTYAAPSPHIFHTA